MLRSEKSDRPYNTEIEESVEEAPVANVDNGNAILDKLK
jgi:hypothetical protein